MDYDYVYFDKEITLKSPQKHELWLVHFNSKLCVTPPTPFIMAAITTINLNHMS